jgi:hypothetical protein
MDFLICNVLVGAGATLTTDLWMIARKRLFGIAPPDYGLVGRWIAYLAAGRFRHDRILAAPAVRDERTIEWIIHYLVGVAFAAILLGIWGIAWIHHPTIGPALLVGIGTVVAPFLVMQPGMGAGIAASRTPRPSAARLQSLVTHAVFGVGLYAAGWVAGFFLYAP